MTPQPSILLGPRCVECSVLVRKLGDVVLEFDLRHLEAGYWRERERKDGGDNPCSTMDRDTHRNLYAWKPVIGRCLPDLTLILVPPDVLLIKFAEFIATLT